MPEDLRAPTPLATDDPTDLLAQRTRRARWAHALVAVLALTGVIMELTIAAVDGPGEAGSMTERLVRLLSYFTILSNITIGVVSIVAAVDPRRDGLGFRVAHLDGLLCIAVTGIVYNTLLRGVAALSQAGAFSNFLLHVAAPLAAVIVWVVVGPRPRIDTRTVLLSVVAPILWLVYTFVRGSIVDWYPYPFLDVIEIGLGSALLNAGIIAVLFLALALGLRWVDGRLRPAP
ncbi:Pr6Pr family membrane protein [Sanguibacter antarcticus]|uniref:FAR-17a/AIG1-like protein n=1 Tax=Sanguibacter antarcticus TaxID=372484 RepID=A0A2A9E9G5_9MICO|nr:Pr6Pr family membrane protein [Sanguibacter antarcticus]PFG34879.1 hypothetical protein ATL42_2810 [Sanguibacter antarcticus]